MSQLLPKDIYSVIADFIPDIKTWYNYCLTNKLVWSVCKPKIKKTRDRFVYTDIHEDSGVRETFVRLKHNNKLYGKYQREMVNYNNPYGVQNVTGLQETGWYIGGKKNGIFTKYDVWSGTKRHECSFKDDLKHGEEYTWGSDHTNSRPIEATTWYLGKKNGASITYAYLTTTGEQIITKYELWEHGKLLESTTYFFDADNHTKILILEYIQLPNGKHQVYYYGTTVLKSQTSYLAGKKHGSHTEYNIDGTLSVSKIYAEGRIVAHHFGTGKPFDNGENNGWRRFYDGNGKFLYKCLFKNGQFVPKSWSSDE